MELGLALVLEFVPNRGVGVIKVGSLLVMVLGHLLVSEWALRQVSEDTANVIAVNGEMNKLGVEIDVGIDWRWYGCSVLVLELRELVSKLVLVWGLGVGVVSVVSVLESG